MRSPSPVSLLALLVLLPAIAHAERKVPFVAPLTYCPGSVLVLTIGLMNLAEAPTSGSVTNSSVEVKASVKYTDGNGIAVEDKFDSTVSLAPGASEKVVMQSTKTVGGPCYSQALASGWIIVPDSAAPSIHAGGNLTGVVVLGGVLAPAMNYFSVNGDHPF